jgi:GAF domain-containing protein
LVVADSSAPEARVALLAGSLGGALAMQEVLYGLPADFPGAILCVQHLVEGSDFVNVLQRCTALPVRWARPSDRWTTPEVIVCPPGRHFVAEASGALSTARLPDPAALGRPVDRSLQSLADACGNRLIALILAGGGSDGAEGVRAVRKGEGAVLVQDQESALAWGMPTAALRSGAVDRIVALQDMAPLLLHWTLGGGVSPATGEHVHPPLLPSEPSSSRDRTLALHDILHRSVRVQGAKMGNIQVVQGGSALEVTIQTGFQMEFLDRFRTVLRDDATVCARAWRQMERVIVHDVEDDPALECHVPLWSRSGFRAVQSTPLLDGRGGLLGMLSTHFAGPRHFSPGELQQLDAHARSAAAVLQSGFTARRPAAAG